MSDKTDATPDVIPAYGEAGPEAESMDRAAEGAPADEAANASEKVLPPDAPVERHGTTETDVAGRISETANRAAQTRQ